MALPTQFAKVERLSPTPWRADIGVDIEHCVFARQMIGQAEASRRSPFRFWVLFGDLRACRLGLGDVGSDIFQAKLQLILVQTLGAASELVALQGLHDLPQPIDLGQSFSALSVARHNQIADHPMQRIDIIRQGSEVNGHG